MMPGQQATLYSKQRGVGKIYGADHMMDDASNAGCMIGYIPRGAASKRTGQRGMRAGLAARYTTTVKQVRKEYQDRIALVGDPGTHLMADEVAAVRYILAALARPDGQRGPVADGQAILSIPSVLAGVVLLPGGPRPARVRLSQALPLPPGDLAAILDHPRRGVTEQVTGRRCVIIGEEDSRLHAYDRTGSEMEVPAAAQALARLGGSFIIDGAALEHAGAFYAFDYLARHAASLRTQPYTERIARLAGDFLRAGLIAQPGATRGRMVPRVPGLGLLCPAVTRAEKAAVLAEVETAGGAGIIIRDLDGPSIPGETSYEQLWKRNDEIGEV